MQATDAPDGSSIIDASTNETHPRAWGLNRFIRDLDRHRQVLVLGWSDKTIYPAYLGKAGSWPASHGQCGVSSVWLLKRLGWFNRTRAWYCCGDVRLKGNAVVDHCWIEVGRPSSSRRLLIDITVDQFELIDKAVLCHRVRDLASQEIVYEAMNRRRLSALTRNDEIWNRLEALNETIASRSPARPDLTGVFAKIRIPLARFARSDSGVVHSADELVG
ncbi:hypothetical protein [Kribbella ginsengisoli]|uniref:Microcin J25-processing protein McjB C-terminal domain-containing protein n=1 Tax=Kribbella ginsengisoli TaxID=363865 RepID=A0ABP6W1P1_9ACTN